jgi:hypothetical protein
MMTPWRSRAAKRNLRAGIGKMEEKLTPADKVYRSFRAGRPFKKDRLMRPPDALAEVCGMRDKLRKLMQDNGLNPNDSRAAVVFQLALDEPPLVKVVPVGRETDVLDVMYGKYMAVTVGALFALKDSERGIIRRWATPFLLNDEAEKMLGAALDEMEKKREWMN